MPKKVQMITSTFLTDTHDLYIAVESIEYKCNKGHTITNDIARPNRTGYARCAKCGQSITDEDYTPKIEKVKYNAEIKAGWEQMTIQDVRDNFE